MMNFFIFNLILIPAFTIGYLDYVLINPVLLNRDGSLNSTNIDDFWKHNSDILNFYIGINFNESLLKLNLESNKKILNQKSFIERKSRNSSQKSFLLEQKPCLFYGNVVDFPNSFVSLSFCRKIVIILKDKKTKSDFFILERLSLYKSNCLLY